MSNGRDELSRAEIAKDAVQSGAEATAHAVGEVATIVTRAVGEVASAVGALATELFEIRDASRRAARDHGELPTSSEPVLDATEADDVPPAVRPAD